MLPHTTAVVGPESPPRPRAAPLDQTEVGREERAVELLHALQDRRVAASHRYQRAACLHTRATMEATRQTCLHLRKPEEAPPHDRRRSAWDLSEQRWPPARMHGRGDAYNPLGR